MELEPIKDQFLADSIDFGVKVDMLEKKMIELPQVDCPVVHSFGPGVYLREVFLAKGTFAIGHHHNFEHQNILLKGHITLFNDDGSKTELKAPYMYVAKPGRKVAYVHEDVVWLNVFGTNETDIEKLEALLLTKSEGFKENQKLLSKVALLTNTANRKDYEAFLKEFNLTEEQARSMSENTEDMCELPFGGYKIKVGQSMIEGSGLFATADIAENELICPARINLKRTIAGRYTNHSVTPNAKFVRNHQNDIDLIATQKINGCKGGLDGEEITVNYREAFLLSKEIGGQVCQP